MKNLKESMKKIDFDNAIKKYTIKQLKGNFIAEGLIIDYDNFTVKLTDENNNGLDISLVNNPIYYRYKNMDIISIFKRTQYIDNDNPDNDGNPFIYALKNIKGWKFNMSNEDIIKYIRRFIQITEKLKDKHFDTVITIPSSFDINNKFMKVLSNQLYIKNKITDYFVKADKKYVQQWLDKNEILEWCEKHYPNRSAEYMTYNIIRSINNGFKKMKHNYFESKYIPKKYLRFIHNIVSINKEYELNDISDLIDGKDIIILDDTISSDHSISEYTAAITETFNSKSVTVITLLSKKFNK